MVLPSIVPRLQARVLSTEFVANNPQLKSLLNHPAGPFTGKKERVCVCVCALVLCPPPAC